MVGPTGEDEMCNFYMMYWVEGKDTIQPNTCFTRWKRWEWMNAPSWWQHQLIFVAQGSTYLVLGRLGLARAWSRPRKHTWPWSFHPIKDLLGGRWVLWLARISRIPAETKHPMKTHLEPKYHWQKKADEHNWLYQSSYQAAPLLWPELQNPDWVVSIDQWCQRKAKCAKNGHRQKVPKHPPIGSHIKTHFK